MMMDIDAEIAQIKIHPNGVHIIILLVKSQRVGGQRHTEHLRVQQILNS